MTLPPIDLGRQAQALQDQASPDETLQDEALPSDLPVAVYRTDEAGRITYLNQAAASLWGRPRLGEGELSGSVKLARSDGTELGPGETAAAIALSERRAVRGMEVLALRSGKPPVRFLCFASPRFDDAGRAVGAVTTMVEAGDNAADEHSTRHYAAIVESSDDAILSKDLDGVITSWNRGAERLFGYTAEEAVGRSVTILIPSDRLHEEPEILSRIRRGERIDHYETVRQRKDGALIDISLTVSPMRDSWGRVWGASKIARDITERKLAQEQQRLLLRETDHRVRNLFAITSGLVILSARAAQTPDELASKLRARLGALARAHALLFSNASGDAEQPTTFGALIRTILSPYDAPTNGGSSRVSIAGPDIPLSARALTGVALLLNEFATNAAKYGALSIPEGSIDIEFSDDGETIAFAWRERGGPRLEPQGANEGFGSFLVRTTVESQLNGEITRNWAPEGLIVRLSIPRNRLTE
ncbi:MAG: PAS domain S-box protein [Bradyrhizobium sp.]|nr:MAG: PAS domain S-box protein [Bradyrhizobium sp.]